ncbi:hypothetical protein R1flu_005678 [Riccia fluitans]|uniref:Uncharacterized protein n=1 Tax=Riccia fluitans TaxID=41844 RepID=A0ABD1YUS5_9MARC
MIANFMIKRDSIKRRRERGHQGGDREIGDARERGKAIGSHFVLSRKSMECWSGVNQDAVHGLDFDERLFENILNRQ